MLYLIDANMLIDASRDYYPINRFPEFWDWLVALGERGQVKVPREVYEKVTSGSDELSQWLKDNKDVLQLPEEPEIGLLRQVVSEGYAPDLTDAELEKLNEDPFLLAYALADARQRCVVTTEISKRKRTRANRHLPDVCGDFNVPCCNTFDLIRQLDFRMNWQP